METTTQPEDKNVCIPDTRWNRYQYLKRHLRGTPRPEVFPIGADDETYYEQDEPQTANTLTANYYSRPSNKYADTYACRRYLRYGVARI